MTAWQQEQESWRDWVDSDPEFIEYDDGHSGGMPHVHGQPVPLVRLMNELADMLRMVEVKLGEVIREERRRRTGQQSMF